MQPELNLRETADQMVIKGLIEYQNQDTLKVTDEGLTIAIEMKGIALNEEKILLDQLDSGQAKLLKDSLISLIKMNT
jgi:Mn-dependent DtxR family transcriptional regulator